jgi:hypothetical protein
MINLYGREWTRQELVRRVGHMDQIAGIKAVELADGLARGIRAFLVWTGSGLTFEVLADRALEICACRYKGTPIGWISPVREAHPSFYEAQGGGWLRTFGGGLFVTGGLRHFGDQFDYDDEPAGVHGRASNLPARAVGYRTFWSGDEYILEISGEVWQGRLYGENLVLRRSISTRLGSNTITIEDTVTNEGFTPQRHMILYHFNIGFPIVDVGSRLQVEVERTIPHNGRSEEGIGAWRETQPPTAGYREQNFWHVPVADDDGKVHVELQSPGAGLAVRWTYDKAPLPYLLQWKEMREGVYLMGVEPCNTIGVEGPAGIPVSEVPRLGPGESVRYAIDVEIAELPGS